ncbi:MAG: hypothetical protein IIZ48_05010, partial [Erysipelotrichales bacterium]|nr:hypothetical protein [Erysipelotrichales bacterium]
MKKICISVLIFMMLCTIKPATALASDYEDYSFYNILQDIEVTEDNGELLIYCPHFDLAKCNLSDYQLEMIHEAGIQKYYGVSGSYSVCNGRPTHVVEAGDPVRKTF